jgi:ABC-type branched-subunit amino acid transport system substrate-binding protein
MRPYFTLFAVLVTLALSGCAGGPGGQSPWTTPSGGSISDRLPQFAPVTEGQSGPQTPLPTSQSTAKTQAPVKVGLLVPLTGSQSELGQAMMNAAQLALFDMGANNVTLLPGDTGKGAAKAADEVLAQGAQIILGPLFAPDVKTVSPIAQSHNVPVIAFSTDWTAATENTYIMGFLPFGQVARVVDYAAKHGAKHFAAVVPETPYGMVVNGSLKNELQRQGIDPPQSLVFNNNGGMTKAVQSLAAAQQPGATQTVDAIMLPLGGPQLTQAAGLLRQNNAATTRIIGTGLWDDSMQAASAVPGAWYAAPDPASRAEFNRKYAATYGKQPPRLSTLAYDATALAAALAVKGQNETGQPAYDRSSLTNPSGFAGLDGVFRFRNDGLAERGLAVLELRPTGPVVLDPAPTRF